MNPSCVPFSGEMSGRTDVIIPIPTNEIDATASTTSAAAKFALRKAQRSKKNATTRRAAPTARARRATAKMPIPTRCTGRESGAMNVYSIVPSQRSQATVSVRISKIIADRYAQMTAPIRSTVVCRSTSICPPAASIPSAMKTIVSVFATVQTKNAISHQT